MTTVAEDRRWVHHEIKISGKPVDSRQRLRALDIVITAALLAAAVAILVVLWAVTR